MGFQRDHLPKKSAHRSIRHTYCSSPGCCWGREGARTAAEGDVRRTRSMAILVMLHASRRVIKPHYPGPHLSLFKSLYYNQIKRVNREVYVAKVALLDVHGLFRH